MINFKSISFIIISLFLIYGCEPPFMETYGPDNTTTETFYAEQTADNGYIAVGYAREPGSSNSDVYVLKTDVAGSVQWEKTIGSPGTPEAGQMFVQTPDNGYLVMANTTFPLSPASDSDIKLIKLGRKGAELYSVTINPFSTGIYGCCIKRTSDGGYIIAGAVQAGDGETLNVMLIKLNSNLAIENTQEYGFEGDDYAWSIEQTEDGGYIVSGYTFIDDDIGSYIYALKLSDTLDFDWGQFYGGQSAWPFPEIKPTTDGGYILVSSVQSTESFGAGNSDAWVIKTDSQGNVEWDQTYGGIDDDFGSSILQVGLDDGYIIGGRTNSFASGYSDAWLIKINSTGEIEWDQTYGGSEVDVAYSVQPTNQGYILAGSSNSYSGDIARYETLLIKTDENGEIE